MFEEERGVSCGFPLFFPSLRHILGRRIDGMDEKLIGMFVGRDVEANGLWV